MIKISHGDARSIIRLLDVLTSGVAWTDNRHINARRTARLLVQRLQRKCEEDAAQSDLILITIFTRCLAIEA